MAQSSEISLVSFTDFADTTERRFAEGADLVSDLDGAKSLFMVENIPAGTGNQRIYDEIDGETYARYKAEGADAAKTQVVDGWNKTMTCRRFAAEIDITYEARAYGKNQEILRKLTSLATFCPQKLALDLTHRCTFMASTSYTDMDGETVDVSMGSSTSTALVDATQDVVGSSTTYSSVITGNPSFSQGGLETALLQANTQIIDNFANRRSMNFNTIWSGDDPSTVREVRQLLNSMSDVTQNNPGVVNVYEGTFRHVVLPRVATTAVGAYDSTKRRYWGLVAAGEWDAHLGIWEAPHLKRPAPGNNGEDLHNDNWTFGARCGYGICVVTARGFLGSTGAGA
jgi:hypothetical protein